MEFVRPNAGEVPASLIEAMTALSQRAAEPLACMVAMTLGLWVDLARAGYLGSGICSGDASFAHRIATHVTVLPAGSLAMYATTIAGLCGALTNGRLGSDRMAMVAGRGAFASAQIAAGAVLMDVPPIAGVGDGVVRVWLAMAAAMAAVHVLAIAARPAARTLLVILRGTRTCERHQF